MVKHISTSLGRVEEKMRINQQQRRERKLQQQWQQDRPMAATASTAPGAAAFDETQHRGNTSPLSGTAIKQTFRKLTAYKPPSSKQKNVVGRGNDAGDKDEGEVPHVISYTRLPTSGTIVNSVTRQKSDLTTDGVGDENDSLLGTEAAPSQFTDGQHYGTVLSGRETAPVDGDGVEILPPSPVPGLPEFSESHRLREGSMEAAPACHSWLRTISIATVFHEILCYGGVVALPHSYRVAGWLGVLVHISTVSVATIVFDFVLSPTAGKNVDRIADEYRVPKYAVYGLMAMNLYLANATTVWLLLFFDSIDAVPPSLFDYAAILRVVGSVALYLMATEITFTAGHACLHHTKRGREIHNIHHLCRPASISANLLFHPVDMMVEFGGPFASLILMHVYIFRDPFVFRTAMTILNIWYTADHDENLGLSHGAHHKEMGTQVLTIYGEYKWFERLMVGKTKKVS